MWQSARVPDANVEVRPRLDSVPFRHVQTVLNLGEPYELPERCQAPLGEVRVTA
jgi:hypothetical protein